MMVTSVAPGDGKTVTSLNIAAASLANGAGVLLIDADERARGLTVMGSDRTQLGLTDLLTRDDIELRDCLVRWKVSEDRYLIVLPAGTPVAASSRVFRAAKFKKRMAELKAAAPFVLVDSPPLLAAAEALDIAAQVDAILLVVPKGAPLGALEEAAARLHMLGKPVLGYVYNRSSPGFGKYGGFGQYGYGYGYGRR